MQRRRFLLSAAMAQGAPLFQQAAGQEQLSFTRFQLACMTLPYSAFPFVRALSGIQKAGYSYVAWGVNHRDDSGVQRPLLDANAPPAEAGKLSLLCRNTGLKPVMMFSTINFEEPHARDGYKKRIDQAHKAGIPYIIVFGKTAKGDYARVIENLQGAAVHTPGSNVTLLIKQHGGNTATGKDCSQIIRDVGHEGVRMCYDAGNVLDYENHDPIPDIRECWKDVHAFAIKDHRNYPADQDCGPGFGEIDHYRLLEPVLRTGLQMPLACENIFAPLTRRPTKADEVDALAYRARDFLKAVIDGLLTQAGAPI